jgi:hypothetical protein
VIANCAFLAAMVLLLGAFALLGELEFLAPYKHLVIARYLPAVGWTLAVVFFNLFCMFYLTARVLFLKDTGRKLAHVERLLRSSEPIVEDLSAEIARSD